MKLSIHQYIVGKPEVRETPSIKKPGHLEKTLWVANKKVNLGYDWFNVDLSYDEIFELLTVDGVAIAPELHDNPRSAKNFASCQIALVDIDKQMSIEELLDNEFYNEYAAGFYTTPSHTMENHRFRIIHVLETPITSVERMRRLYCGLMLAYGSADESCKDAARLFFGTVNAEIFEKRSNILPDDVVDVLVNLVVEAEASTLAADTTLYKPLEDDTKKQIVDALVSCFVGEYATWRNIGWGMKSGGFSLEDFQYVTTGMMNKKSADDAKTVWDSCYSNNKVSMGTIFHFLKQRGININISSSEPDDNFNAIYIDKFGQTRLNKRAII